MRLILLSATLTLSACSALSDYSARKANSDTTAVYQPPVSAESSGSIIQVKTSREAPEDYSEKVCGMMSPSYFVVYSDLVDQVLGDNKFSFEELSDPAETIPRYGKNGVPSRLLEQRYDKAELACWARAGDQVSNYVLAKNARVREQIGAPTSGVDWNARLDMLGIAASQDSASSCFRGKELCSATETKVFPLGLPAAHVELFGMLQKSDDTEAAQWHLEQAVKAGSGEAFYFQYGYTRQAPK